MSHKKFGPGRFSRFDVYWIQTNRQTDKPNLYIDMIRYLSNMFRANDVFTHRANVEQSNWTVTVIKMCIQQMTCYVIDQLTYRADDIQRANVVIYELQSKWNQSKWPQSKCKQSRCRSAIPYMVLRSKHDNYYFLPLQSF